MNYPVYAIHDSHFCLFHPRFFLDVLGIKKEVEKAISALRGWNEMSYGFERPTEVCG